MIPSSRDLVIIAVVIVLAIFIPLSATFVVDERKQALVVRFGEIQRSVTEPGLYFKVPLVDEVISMEGRLLSFETLDKTVQVDDRRRYLVDTITFFKISDPKKFREVVAANIRNVEGLLNPRLESTLRQEYGVRTFQEALTGQRREMMQTIKDRLSVQANSLGIEIVDVLIRRTDLTPDVLGATYRRMSTEREAKAEELRAVGNERKLSIIADAERKARIMVADAKKEAQLIKGQGDAERNRILAEAFGQDEEFFAFYRSMLAYKNSLGSGVKDEEGDAKSGADDSNSKGGTTYVIDPKSEFFDYFLNSKPGSKKTSSIGE